MKAKFYFTACLISLFAMMAACTETEDISGNDTPPQGALPSAEFTPNQLPDEPYAADAIRIVAEQEDAPFYAIELMPDGTFLLQEKNYGNHSAPQLVRQGQNDQKFVVRKQKHNSAVRTRATLDDDGIMTIPGVGKYGKFVKKGNNRYCLGEDFELTLMEETGSNLIVSFKNMDGTVSNVYVRRDEPQDGWEDKSICRTWNYNGFERWAYMNGKYIAHGKQYWQDGHVETYFKSSWDIMEEDELLDDPSDMCKRVVFTPHNTFICFYADGDVDVAGWYWKDRSKGILYYCGPEYYYGPDEEADDGYVTVRLKGNQMRIYEDCTVYDDSDYKVNCRNIAVNTLTTAY